MKDYEDEAFDELEKKLQKQVAHGVTDGSLWRKRQEPERSMKVEGPLHVVCQCDKCKPQISFNAEVIGYVEPQRTWVELTDKELNKFDIDPIEAKLMIAKLKEKNNIT